MRRSRIPAPLSPSFHRQLDLYALAASAAGVGMLALAPPAAAKIIYTPARHNIGINQHYNLDLNHDGTADFQIVNVWGSDTDLGPAGSLSVFSAQKGKRNGILGYGTVNQGTFPYFASALPVGAAIGPPRAFYYPKWIDWMFRASVRWGPWKDVTNRYLGFKFEIKGKPHYGWARLNAHFNPNNYKIAATLTGYAYETIPNKAIIAGKTKGPGVITVQPASLGHLARGVSSIASPE
jgi:hypothetical protein